jgi:hypothetical protein
MSSYFSRTLFIASLLLSVPAYAQESDTTVYEFADVEAAFPGGHAALMNWVVQHITYDPDTAFEEFPGKILISFIVEKDGSISHAQALHTDFMSEAAARCVSAMPPWIPARHAGNNCSSLFLLPLYICYAE